MGANPTTILRVSALALALLAMFGGPAAAAFLTIVRSSASTGDRDMKFKAKQAARQVTVTSIQENFDPSANEFLTVFCSALARTTPGAEDGPVSFVGSKNVKANWSAKLLVIDEGAGTIESVELGSGTFKTEGDGRARWRSTIETADFAEGFPESISAVVQTEVRFRKGKKVNGLDVFCSYP